MQSLRFIPMLWLGLVLAGAVIDVRGIEKIIRTPLITDYGVTNIQFAHTLSQQLHAPLVPGNHVETLLNGTNFFPAMLRAIASATNSVTFENFIWDSGAVSDRFIEALSERARAGVKVMCLVDGIGAFEFKRADRKRLRESGAQLVIFNPMRPWNPWRWNHRTHRKTLVIDGKVGFIGGMGIADEWDWDGVTASNDFWRENQYRVEGPVVGQMQGVFMDNWTRMRSEVLHGEPYFPDIPDRGGMLAQCFKSGPVDGAENARMLYLYSIAAAQRSIRLAHSYFVPDNLAIKMLLAARQRGVKIEVITPGATDWNMVRRAARSRWDRLLEAGVEFYEYQPAKLHLKVMIVDEVWVTAGSINFDDRSFRINGEANLNVLDAEFARRQVEIFEQDKANSTRIDPEAFRKRPWSTKLIESFYGLFRGML